MRKINIFEIHPGDRFEQPLFTVCGQKLLNAGVPITLHHLRVFHNLADPDLYLANTVAEIRAALDAAPGMIPESAPRPSRSAWRFAAMRPSVMPRRVGTDGDPQRREPVSEEHAAVASLLASVAHAELRVPASVRDLWGMHTPGSEPHWPGVTDLVRTRMQMVERVRAWQVRLNAGEPLAPGPLQEVVRELFGLLLEYPTRFTQIALLCPRRDNYIPDHAVCVASLAMATAGRMNWSAVHVQKVGLCALVADVGMLRMPERVLTTGTALSDDDRRNVERHPALGVAMLQRVPLLDPVVKLAAYQHHERGTGVGYPAQTRGEKICDFAKVLAVCDVFAAGTGPRAYHPGKLPYVVMEEIIRSAAAGIFDKAATRALVRAAGLFPVGSCVLLSTNQIAQVLAANPDRLDRPLVRLFEDDGQPGDRVIDLAAVPPEKLGVIRPSAPPWVTPSA